MKAEYDFSKSKPNPYIKKLKKQITIRLDIDTIDYFKKIADETGVPYQNLINLPPQSKRLPNHPPLLNKIPPLGRIFLILIALNSHLLD